MFTNTKCSIYAGQDKVYTESVCLSTDAKPTTGIANGSTCIEMNTGKKFMYNEDGGEWVEVPSSGGGGGGGGSSDFSTAQVTVVSMETGSTSELYYIPFEDSDGLSVETPFAYSEEEHILTVPLYKGATSIVASEDIIISGDATYDSDNGLVIITGDCSIKGYAML